MAMLTRVHYVIMPIKGMQFKLTLTELFISIAMKFHCV